MSTRSLDTGRVAIPRQPGAVLAPDPSGSVDPGRAALAPGRDARIMTAKVANCESSS